MRCLRKDSRSRRAKRVFVCACLLLTAIDGVSARNVYRWVDAQGMVHYTDQPPTGTAASRVPVTTVRVEGEVQKLATLRLDSSENHYDAVVTNMQAGPVEIELRAADASNIASDPPLPLRVVLKPYESVKVATLSLADPTRPSGKFALQLGNFPGDPHAQPQDVIYRLPVESRDWRMGQGWHGRFSHNDAQSGYAIDIVVDEGTPVLAARDGTVMMVDSDFDKAGLNREKFVERANAIRIVHDDGTMAVYGHLKLDGQLVRPGQRVRAGQRIGYSGNTGYTGGPHLHFCVQVNRGFDLESIPFRMQGPAGPVTIPDER